MYKIRGKYPGQPWETVDEFETLDEAEKALAEYRLAFGSEWLLCIAPPRIKKQ